MLDEFEADTAGERLREQSRHQLPPDALFCPRNRGRAVNYTQPLLSPE